MNGLDYSKSKPKGPRWSVAANVPPMATSPTAIYQADGFTDVTNDMVIAGRNLRPGVKSVMKYQDEDKLKIANDSIFGPVAECGPKILTAPERWRGKCGPAPSGSMIGIFSLNRCRSATSSPASAGSWRRGYERIQAGSACDDAKTRENKPWYDMLVPNAAE